MWEIHTPASFFRESIPVPVPLGFQADTSLVLQKYVRSIGYRIKVLQGRCEASAPERSRDHPGCAEKESCLHPG